MPQQYDNTPLEHRIFSVGEHNTTGLALADIVTPTVLASLSTLQVEEHVYLAGVPFRRVA